MLAIIAYKNNQYKVEEGKEYNFDLLEISEDKKIIFDHILLIDDGKSVKIGTPEIKGASAEGEIIGDIKGEKISSIKFHAKKRYKRTLGHTQKYTRIKISQIKL